MNIFKSYLLRIWSDGAEANNRAFASLVGSSQPRPKVLDLGSFHPDLTREKFSRLDSPRIYTVDLSPKVVKLCKAAGMVSKVANVEKMLPFPANSFHFVTANQLVEHLLHVDKFMLETFRVLVPGGYLVISTENLSAWHNVFALVMGWQAFSQHISERKNIGNPWRINDPVRLDPHGLHIKVFTPSGLSELTRLHGFKIVSTFGAGYAPFTSLPARLFSRLDPRHAMFIGLLARKPL